MTRKESRDPTRGLQLLWDLEEPATRGPKPALSLTDIVRAGIEICDRGGLAALSMRVVAERLGFTTMSLYRHVPGKEELVEVMRDVAIGAPPKPEPDGDWRSELSRWARANLAVHHRHPWLLDVEIRRPPFGPNHLRWLDAGLRATAELDLADPERIAAVLLVDSFVRGVARFRVGLAQEERRTRASRAELAKTYAQIFGRVVTDARYPTLAKAVAAGAFEPSAPKIDEFEFGLERALDGLAAHVAARRRRG